MKPTPGEEHRPADESPAAGPLLVKIVPPRIPGWFVERPGLDRRLDEAGQYRLTVVVAGAGFGKSTALGARALANGWAWYTIDRSDRSPTTLGQGILAALRRVLPGLPMPVLPISAGSDDDATADGLASLIAQALEDEHAGEVVLVLDDVHEVALAPTSTRLVESLLRYAPATLHLVLASRYEPPFSIVRMRGRGEVLDVSSRDLEFSPAETAARLEAAGSEDVELADKVQTASDGWPAAVQLAAEMLASGGSSNRDRLLAALSARGGPLFAFLAEEAFGAEPPETLRVVATAAQFDRVTPELCEALGCRNAAIVLRDLSRRGLVTAPPADVDDWYTLHALVREFALESWPMSPAELRALRRRAARWFESAGRYGDALEALTDSADAGGIVRMITTHGRELTDQGSIDALIAAGSILPLELRRDVAITVAHAHSLRGEFDRAFEWLAALEDTRGVEEDRNLKFQIALVHINRDEPRRALEVLRSVIEPDDGARLSDEGAAMVPAFMAYQLMALGRLDEARGWANRAFEAAKRLPEILTPLAEAHMALGDVSFHDGQLAAASAHYETAMSIAESLGNVLATCSALNRRSTVAAAHGDFPAAVTEAGKAIALADRVGFSLFQAWSPTSRGMALLALGRLDEAAADFSTARVLEERLDSGAVSVALCGLADVHLARGELTQARSAYERALAVAERSGRARDRVNALCGLARALVDDDPDEAERNAGAASDLAFGSCITPALLTKGWVALRLGDRQAARTAADAALEDARLRGVPGLIAHALELRALCEAEPDRRRLEEAHAIWSRIGAQLDRARTALALARLDARSEDAAEAERALRDLGVRDPEASGAGLLQMLAPSSGPPLAVRTLGHFAVLRDGRVVPASDWQSKKARDLLKILVAHRGQSVARERLMELLWPDEDPRKTANRLSVALNVVRSVLDPLRTREQDHFVASDGEAVRLVLAHVTVDVEQFLAAAAAGLDAARLGRDDAAAQLRSAEAAFGGEFLEENRYEDWSITVRDEVRTAYLEVLRALAAVEAASESPSAAYHLRALAVDPYDEEIHLALVSMLAAGGRHGEARRAYRQYVDRMREIEVEPAAFPAPRAALTSP